MFKHYLSSALRHFARHNVTTAVNILCLWLGIMVFVAAYAMSAQYFRMDLHHEKAERTYFITQDSRFAGAGATLGPTPFAGFGIAPHLKADYPELEQVARITIKQDTAVAAKSEKAFTRVSYADPEVLKILDLDFVAGDRREALREPGSALISETFAKRLFGDANAIGQSLLLNNAVTVHVTGIVKRSTQPSHITMDYGMDDFPTFSVLADWSTLQSMIAARQPNQAELTNEYFRLFAFTYVLFRDSAHLTPEQLRNDLGRFADRHVPAAQGHAILNLRPITQMGRTILNMDVQTHRTGMSFTMILLGAGLLILCLACLNYANLTSAQTSTRLKELALLRTVGASRRQIVTQVLFEAVLVISAALCLVFVSLPMALNWLRILSGVDYSNLVTGSSAFWGWMLIVVGSAAVIASLYPAIVATRIRPAQALHSGRAPQDKRRAMTWIVVAQCVIATWLLIFAGIMNTQTVAMSQARITSTDDPLIYIGNNLQNAGIDRTTLLNELRRQPSIKAVSAIESGASNSSPRRQVMASDKAGAKGWMLSAPAIDYDFFQTMGMPIIAGRDFDRRITSDLDTGREVSNVIVDTVLAAQYGWHAPQDAIGKSIFVPSSGARGATGIPRTVVGVVNVQDLYPVSIGMSPARFYSLNPERASTLFVRVSKENVAAGIAALDKVWSELAPNIPLQHGFLNDKISNASGWKELAKVFRNLALAALFIATMGIVGIATHSINQRLFEIGVRKALGASVKRVLSMLLRDISKPLVIANAIAWPLAFVVGSAYLTLFAKPASISVLPFIASFALGIGLAWLAVLRQATRAARMNPAMVLRHE